MQFYHLPLFPMSQYYCVLKYLNSELPISERKNNINNKEWKIKSISTALVITSPG